MPGNTGLSAGDPHLRTFDGVKYDMQGVGEFVLAHDATDGLEVQTRTRHYTGRVAVNIAVAAQIAGDRFGFYLDGVTRLNGAAVDFAEGENVLPGGGRVFRSFGVSRYVLVWPDNAQLHIGLLFDHMNVRMYLPDARRGGGVTGMLGDFDGVEEGDLIARDGTVLPPRPAFEDFYGLYVESWRVTPESTLFDYVATEGTETFTDRSLPRVLATTADLSAAAYNDALAICVAAGVPDEWLDSCILDVGLTGDSGYAQDFVDAPSVSLTVEVEPPLCPGVFPAAGPLCVFPDAACAEALYTCNGTYPDCDCAGSRLPPPDPLPCAGHEDCPGGLCYADADCGGTGTCAVTHLCAAGTQACGCNGVTYATGCDALAAGSISYTEGACPPLNLQLWTQEGAPGNGTWQVAEDGLSVLQTVNGDPTFFVGPEDFIDTTIRGTFRVETGSDDDIIGFVLGYRAPLASSGDAEDAFDFILFDWKQTAQNNGGGFADEGFTLSRLSGPVANIWTSFWGHTDDIEVLATDYGDGRGWTENEDHAFEAIYELDRIRISVDGETIFDVAGDFPAGRFGFYNFSQQQVRYLDFMASGL